MSLIRWCIFLQCLAQNKHSVNGSHEHIRVWYKVGRFLLFWFNKEGQGVAKMSEQKISINSDNDF